MDNKNHFLLTNILCCAHSNPDSDLVNLAIANQELFRSVKANTSKKNYSGFNQKQR